MSKIIGYGLSLAGLAILALSNKIAQLSFLANTSKPVVYAVMPGIVLLVVGIVLLMSNSSSSNIKQAAEEVPIYEGEGKKRKIVGYQKASK